MFDIKSTKFPNYLFLVFTYFVLILSCDAAKFNKKTLGSNRHVVPYPDWFIEKLFFEYGSFGNNKTMSIDDLEHLMDDIGILHANHNHGRIKYSRLKNSNRNDDYENCYTAEELGEIFSFDNSTEIDFILFKEIAPAIISMATTTECTISTDHDVCPLSMNKRYLYGSLSILVVSILAFLSIVLVGKFGKIKSLLIKSLTGLALGTLLSDALLHIIPAAVGIHVHSNEDLASQSHDHDAEEDITYVWVLSVVFATIIMLWLLETFLEGYGGHSHSHSHDHEHSHGNGVNMNNLGQNQNEKENEEVAVKQPSLMASFKAVRGRGWTMAFGDVLHNLTDGIAIAASFSQSSSLGFSTALAILFHEIPHEISSFVVMRRYGFTYGAALIMNIVGAVISLVGFFIVTAITGSPSVWLFAITAGVFIYISLVDLLQDIKDIFETKDKRKKFLTLVLVLFFTLLGWTLMLLLAIYEEQIDIQIDSSCDIDEI